MLKGRTFRPSGLGTRSLFRRARIAPAIIIAIALLWALPAGAAAAWAPVGGVLNLDPTHLAARAATATIAGTPWVSFEEENAGGVDQVRVSHLTPTGWSLVGGALNANPAKDGFGSSITAVGSVPYVAWTEDDNRDNNNVALSEIRVAREVGGSWHQIATPSHDLTVSGDHPRIADVGGVPYVAWEENTTIYVSRFNGSAWVPVGAAVGSGLSPSIADVAGVPYLTWESIADGEQVTVARFSAGAWHTVGGPLDAYSARDATIPVIADVGGVPYVAWRESNGSVEQIRVARLNGSSWIAVGGSLNYDESQNASTPQIAEIGGAPAVAWAEDTQSTGDARPRIRVARLIGGVWTEVGGALDFDLSKDGADPGITSVGGVPYVVWDEAVSQAFSGGQVRAARLEPDFLQSIAVATDTVGLLITKVRDYGVPLPIAFRDGLGTKLTTQSAVQTTLGTGYDVIFTKLTGLKPATTYSWQPFGTDTFRQTAAGPIAKLKTSAAPRVSKLVLVAFGATVSPKVVTVRYVLTGTARLKLTVKSKHGRAATVTTASGHSGTGKLSWNRKLAGKRAKPGSYKLTITAAGASKTVSSSVTVKLH